MNDNDYMRMALDLAAKAAGYVAPNPMVGAVVVNRDRVVGQGYHQALGGPHAEVNALGDAGEQARGGTIYVTLEPCNHHGRTPPCTKKILESGIKRVVAAIADPNPGVTGGGNNFLMSRGIEVQCGVEEEAARRLNESFIKYSLTRRPFVVLKMAATLDGRIATRTGDARWVTGPQSRAVVHMLRHAMDAIMVGVGTVMADDPRLDTRLENGQGVDPMRIVLDTHLNMPGSARMLRQPSAADTWIVCAENAPGHRKKQLQSLGAHIMETRLKDKRIDLQALMQQLGERGVTSILVEGGSRVAAAALKQDVVDKALFFYAPKLLGGDDGIPMCSGEGPARMSDCLPLLDTDVCRVGDDILVTGYRHPIGN